MTERHTIPARKGLALPVSKGQRYRVLNTHGTQIVDHWAFNTRAAGFFESCGFQPMKIVMRQTLKDDSLL